MDIRDFSFQQGIKNKILIAKQADRRRHNFSNPGTASPYFWGHVRLKTLM